MNTRLLLGGLMAITVLSMAAPSIARPTGHPRVHEVNGRRQNQHDRIQKGLKNGTITKGEAQNLRQEGKAIHAQEKTMRANNGGHLTKQDQKTLNAELNQRSKEIHTDKHN